MYISCLIGFIIIFLYCAIITVKDREMPNSISQIVYSLSEKWKWTFSAVLVTVAFMIVPQLMTVVDEEYRFLSFFVVLGILGVAADPLVKGESNHVHYASAVIMGVSSQILVYIMNPYLLLLWFPYVVYTFVTEDGRKNMFLGEMVMLTNTACICLLKITLD